MTKDPKVTAALIPREETTFTTSGDTTVTAKMVHAAEIALHDMLWPDKTPTQHTWTLPVGSTAIAKMIKAALKAKEGE